MSESAALEENSAKAWVDGSFSPEEKAFAYGVILFFRGETHIRSGRREDEELLSMRNVAGELVAAWRAMQFCMERKIHALELYYDYEGIEKWCTGAWKANKQGTKAYRDYYRRISAELKVSFHKVRGHSGDKYNELVDKLAKKALRGEGTEGWQLKETEQPEPLRGIGGKGG